MKVFNTKLLSSSPKLEDAEKMVNNYFYSSSYKLIPYQTTRGIRYDVVGMKGKLDNFIVKKVYDATETDNNRVSQTGSIEVQFGGTLPSESINLDHFLIRRYVDDASQVLFEGFKPTNSQGPYIITPEYVTPSLNQNVDTFITDLTQKGLI
jgi:hypothetical protein